MSPVTDPRAASSADPPTHPPSPSALFGAVPEQLRAQAALVSIDGATLLTFQQLEQRALGFAALLRSPSLLHSVSLLHSPSPLLHSPSPLLHSPSPLRAPATPQADEAEAPIANLALLSQNRPEYLEVVLGAIAGGAWLTPLNWHLTPTEIEYILEDSASSLVIVDPELQGLLPGHTKRLVLGPEYEATLARAIAEASRRAPEGGATPGGTRIYTSGTSGRPKGVERQRAPTLDAAWEALRAAGRALGLDGQRLDGTRHVHLITGPMYHAAPLMFALYDLMNGACLSLMPRWSESAFMSCVPRLGVSHTHLVPTMCVRLLGLDETQRARFDASSLELVMHGAAPISPNVKHRMIDWWGPRLLEYWGATEGGVYTLIDSADWLNHPGSVGKALPKFEIFAVDDSGRRLGPAEVGTLYCRHRELPQPFVYHRAEEKTRGCYLEPHVFTAGDLGHVDSDGYVFLSARRSNLILSGGVNIYPAEIEAELQESPWVADVAVYGAPDSEWGERTCAAIELSQAGRAERERVGEPVLRERLLASLEGRLAHYKWPRTLRFVDALPRLPTGKIRHEALRALEADDRADTSSARKH